jgi:hypothetical protein
VTVVGQASIISSFSIPDAPGQELSGREYFHAAEGMQHQKIAVAANNDLGSRLQGATENVIVVRVAAPLDFARADQPPGFVP